jgi:hypothetical protein
MTPQEKAKELVDKFYQQAPLEDIKFYSNDVMAKDCALIAVDEILQSNNLYNSIKTKFYLEVKQEIEKL